MEKNRDDFLNDLIKYYDGDTPPANQESSEDIGATRVISKKPPEPQDEEMGKTVVMDVKKAAKKQQADEAENLKNNTVRIETPVKATTEPPQAEPIQPVEEVLGSMDLGSMSPASTTIASEPIIDIPLPEKKTEPELYDETDILRNEIMKKRTGLWYSLKPLWITIMLCIVAVAGIKFYMTDNGIIGTYKRNFNYNMGLIFNMLGLEWDPSGYVPVIGMTTGNAAILSENTSLDINISEYTEQDNTHEEARSEYKSENRSCMIPFDEAGSSEISAYCGGVVCAKSNYLCFIDTNGKICWETETSISNPLLSSCGQYIALASNNGTQLSLYKQNKLIFSIEAPHNIRSCNVSARGDIALITDKPSYKGAVVLVNSKGETVFSWSSGVNYITAANVLKNRRIIVSLVNASDRITSYVMLFDIKSTEPFAGTELRDSLIYSLDTNGRLIYASGDNCISCISGKGSIKYDMRYDDVDITHTAVDNKGYRLVTYTQQNLPVMNLYNNHGSIIDSYIIEGIPDFIDIYRHIVLYNNGRDIICGKIDSEKKYLYTASRTIKSLKLIDSDTYAVVYADGIEIINI